jgi:hypothetical protein
VLHQLTACRRLNAKLVALSRSIYSPSLHSVFPGRTLARRAPADAAAAAAGGAAAADAAWLQAVTPVLPPGTPPSHHPLHRALEALFANCTLLCVRPCAPLGSDEEALLAAEASAAAQLAVGLLTCAGKAMVGEVGGGAAEGAAGGGGRRGEEEASRSGAA